MSLLQQIVDTIGETIGFEEQPSVEPPKTKDDSSSSAGIEVVVAADPEKDKKEEDDRDDGSSTCTSKKQEKKNSDDPSTTIAAAQEKKDAMIEITNLVETVHIVDGAKSKKEKNALHCTSFDNSEASNSSVSFGSVRVREYERVIDSTNMYMGLALGWNYNDKVPTPVREKNKASKYSVSSSHGGESRMKRTNGSDRYGMMIKYGYAQKELKQATKEAAQFYKQRSRDAARSIVVADERNKQQNQPNKPKRRPMLLRSMFG